MASFSAVSVAFVTVVLSLVLYLHRWNKKYIFTPICCGTFRLFVSPLVALWPLLNLWLTLWRHCILRKPSQWPHQSQHQQPGSRFTLFSPAAVALFSFCRLLFINMTASAPTVIRERLPNLTNYCPLSLSHSFVHPLTSHKSFHIVYTRGFSILTFPLRQGMLQKAPSCVAVTHLFHIYTTLLQI